MSVANCSEGECEAHDSAVEVCNSLTSRKNPNLSGFRCFAGYPRSSSVESCFGFEELQDSSVVSEGCNHCCFDHGIRSGSSNLRFPLCSDALSWGRHDEDHDGLQQFFPTQVHVKQQPSRVTCQSWLLSHPALASVSRARFLRTIREPRRTGVLVRQELFVCGEFLVNGESLCWIAGLRGCLLSVAAAAPILIHAVSRIKSLLKLSMLEKIRVENRVNTWCARLLRECLKQSVHFWVGSPSSSFWWKLRCFQKLLKLSAVNQSSFLSTCVIDLCRAGAPWRQRTLVLTNLPSFPSRILCSRDHSHQVLTGSGPGGQA